MRTALVTKRSTGKTNMAHNNKPPRVRLKEIRERVGISGGKLANQLGYASPSGYLKYEQEKTWGDKPIPYEVVKRLIPYFRGAGNPPVTVEEVLAVSDVKAIPRTVSQAYSHVVDDGQGLLTVQYRVESGVFIRPDSKRSLGAARIGVTPEYPASSQFVAVLAEDMEGGWPSRTQLLCVQPDQFPNAFLRGKRVLIGVEEGSGLMEVCLGRIGADDSIYGLDGLPREASVLGVIVAFYQKEL